jgi:hypothetical protein
MNTVSAATSTTHSPSHARKLHEYSNRSRTARFTSPKSAEIPAKTTIHTSSATKKTKSGQTWAVADLFSTDTSKKEKLLSHIMEDRSSLIQRWVSDIDQATNHADTYSQNTKALYTEIARNTLDSIKSAFKSNLSKNYRSIFIHVICDAAHLTGLKHICEAANYFLIQKTDRLAKTSFAAYDSFLNPRHIKTPIQTIYTQSTTGAAPVLAQQTFGNILFRLTSSDDIMFSPVFLSYIERDAAKASTANIPAQKVTWDTMSDDDMFYEMGFKKLTDRDAVAHYRWLTEVATPEEFAEYLSRIGTETAPTPDTIEHRQATLKRCAQNYWAASIDPSSTAAPDDSHLDESAKILNAAIHASAQKRTFETQTSPWPHTRSTTSPSAPSDSEQEEGNYTHRLSGIRRNLDYENSVDTTQRHRRKRTSQRRLSKEDKAYLQHLFAEYIAQNPTNQRNVYSDGSSSDDSSDRQTLYIRHGNKSRHYQTTHHRHYNHHHTTKHRTPVHTTASLAPLQQAQALPKKTTATRHPLPIAKAIAPPTTAIPVAEVVYWKPQPVRKSTISIQALPQKESPGFLSKLYATIKGQ